MLFPSRFVPSIERWLQDRSGEDWHGAEVTWLGSIFEPNKPFGASPWRRERGGLWDVGPHTLAVTVPLLGRVERLLSAVRDRDGTVRFLAEHVTGATSVQTVGLDVPRREHRAPRGVRGPGLGGHAGAGRRRGRGDGPGARAAARHIAAAVASSPCDVEFERCTRTASGRSTAVSRSAAAQAAVSSSTRPSASPSSTTPPASRPSRHVQATATSTPRGRRRRHGRAGQESQTRPVPSPVGGVPSGGRGVVSRA
ncbi:MAG: hypothetical protein M3P93_00580 [Actinomycetota bacterium]|nr:hypothetical protein [Actinomycetota bacterium]